MYTKLTLFAIAIMSIVPGFSQTVNNPGFEQEFNSWGTSGSGASEIVIETENGNKFVSCTPTNFNQDEYGTTWTLTQLIGSVSKGSYEISFKIRTTDILSGGAAPEVHFLAINNTGNALIYKNKCIIRPGGWRTHYANFTADSDLDLRLSISYQTKNIKFDIDDIEIKKIHNLIPYQLTAAGFSWRYEGLGDFERTSGNDPLGANAFWDPFNGTTNMPTYPTIPTSAYADLKYSAGGTDSVVVNYSPLYASGADPVQGGRALRVDVKTHIAKNLFRCGIASPYFNIAPDGVSLSGKQVRLSFWAKSVITTSYPEKMGNISITNMTTSPSVREIINIPGSELTTEWKQYSFDFTVGNSYVQYVAGYSSGIWFRFQFESVGIVQMDYITLQEKDTSTSFNPFIKHELSTVNIRVVENKVLVESETPASIKLYSLNGVELDSRLNSTFYEKTIYNHGVYILRVVTKDGVKEQKIML